MDISIPRARAGHETKTHHPLKMVLYNMAVGLSTGKSGQGRTPADTGAHGATGPGRRELRDHFMRPRGNG